MNKTLILVVEDDTPVHNLITTTLKTHDYKYISAKNGAGAIMEASTHNPDIVLLDLGLPDIDGVEVIEKIRSWSNMPIIVISARSEDSDKIEALDAGADDYLTKPFSVEELLARLRVTQRRLSQMQAENGIVSPALAKMELIFTKNTKIEALPTITNAEKNYSLTAVLGEDGIYRFDFTGDGATLSPNTVYTVTYGDTSAQLTTGEGIVQSAVPVIDSDGKASTIITNTSETATNVYIISAY